MKIILFIVIFLLGVATYAFIDGYLSMKSADVPVTATSTQPVMEEASAVVETAKQSEREPEVVITEDGAQLDVENKILAVDGTSSGVTARIIRSPEETLISFNSDNIEYPRGTHIYLAEDMMGNGHFDVAQANVHEGVLIYGLPLDIDLSKLTYLVFYDTLGEETVFYARLR